MTHMTTQHKIGLLLLVIAYALLIPGLTLPIIHVVGTIDKATMVDEGMKALFNSPNISPFIANLAAGVIESLEVSGTLVIQDKQTSILGTADELWQNGNPLVGALIVFFSVIIPILKGFMLGLGALLQRTAAQSALATTFANIAGALSKWSMADVFAVALIVTFLATNATTANADLFVMTSTFEEGFYYFIGYCVLSIASAQLMINAKN